MKNIIFDLGNVLLSFQPEEYLSKHFDKEIYEELMIIIFCSDEWIELDLGNMLIDDVLSIFNKEHPEYKDEMTYVLKHWTDMLSPIEKNVKILRELKELGYCLYILSNFHIEAFETMQKKYDFLGLFDGGIISGYEHVIKPDREIYRLLLERYCLDPRDCLFIDDSLSNIEVGMDLGIDGIHMKYGVDLYEELVKKGIMK